MKITTVYGTIYIVLFKEKKIENVRVFTDIYMAEKFCTKVSGKIFIKIPDE